MNEEEVLRCEAFLVRAKRTERAIAQQKTSSSRRCFAKMLTCPSTGDRRNRLSGFRPPPRRGIAYVTRLPPERLALHNPKSEQFSRRFANCNENRMRSSLRAQRCKRQDQQQLAVCHRSVHTATKECACTSPLHLRGVPIRWDASRRRHGYTVDLYRINLIHFFATRGSQHQYACSVAAEADAFRAKAHEL